MADKPRGRGRGRGRTSTPPKPPSEETVAMLAANSVSAPQTLDQTSEQFADIALEEPVPTAEHFHDNPSPLTTIGEDKNPPLVKDLTDALQRGVTVGGASKFSPEFSHFHDNPSPLTTIGEDKNPPLVKDLKDALQRGVTVGGASKFSPEFSPTSFQFGTKVPYSLSNGPSTAFSFQTGTDVPQQPVMSKMQIPFRMPGLNAGAPEFVPGFSAQANFANGFDPNPIEQPLGEMLGPDDILSGFKPVAEGKDLAIQPIMKAAADMLVKGTLYIGSFDRFKVKILTTLGTFSPSVAVFENLAEMLIHWGVVEPYFRCTSCKMCEVIWDGDNSHQFRKALLGRVKAWYSKESDEDQYRIINFSLFVSELFSRIKIGNQPVEVVANSIFDLVNKLLALKSNDTVIGACNILKLTGVLLEECDTARDDEKKMEKVINLLKDLVTEPSLSRSCTELLARVIEQRARKWAYNGDMSKLTAPSLQLAPTKEDKGRLNADAIPFIPSIFQLQQPVTNVEEWKEFETEYDSEPIEGVSVDYDYPDGDDGLDPDIELEMEAFIEEIEEHLLMQEFDPDLEHM